MAVHAVPSATLGVYRDHLREPQPELVVASVLAGNTAAQLWLVQQPAAADLLLLWDKGNNVFYLAGELASATAEAELAGLIAGPVRDQALAEGRARFKVRALTSSIAQALPALFDGIALRELEEHFLRFEAAQPPSVPTPAAADLQFAPIDRALLARDDLEHIGLVRDEVAWMWLSAARFEQHGFGTVALVGRTIVCWCTAEYVSRAACGIGIATAPAYERRGVATATAAQFVGESLRRGVAPHWECASANRGSLRVAEKLGFTLLEAPQLWVGELRTTEQGNNGTKLNPVS